MSRARELWDRLVALRHRDVVEQEIDEELRFHVEMATERNIARGLSPAEARRRALVEFGGMARYTEAARVEVASPWPENAWQDLRYAMRTIRRSPGFAAAVVLTLALGMGAATAMFSVVNAVVLRPLPFPDPDRVVFLGWEFAPGRLTTNLTAFQLNYVRRHARSVEGVATYRTFDRDLGDQETPRTVQGLSVSEDFFRVVGMRPLQGRLFTAEEERPGGDPVVLLAESLWRSEFGGAPDIVGREIRLGPNPVTVIGVVPDIELPSAPGSTQALLPLRLEPDIRDEGHNSEALTRLRAGWTTERVRDDLAAVTRSLHDEHPQLLSNPNGGLRLLSYQDVHVGSLRTTLWMLLGAVGCVLLIACVNAANLLLARAVARQQEIVLRAAIGAGRGRILRQLLIEGLAVATAAGVLGTIVGMWSVRVVVALAPRTLPRADVIGLDHRVLAFTFAIVVVTGVVFGLVAALPTWRLDLVSALGARTRNTPGRARLRDLLVVVETAFAVVLLTGAGLLIASFARLRGIDPGFSVQSVLATRFERMPRDYDAVKRWEFERALLERVRQIPSVEAAGGVTSFPLERGVNMPMVIEGRPDQAEGDIEWRGITPGYLEALKVPIRRGRAFAASDAKAGVRVAIINETFAKRFFPDEDPIGKRVEIGRWKGNWLAPGFASGGAAEIVGVVADVREMRLDRDPKRTLFVPLDQWPDIVNRVQFVARTSDPGPVQKLIESTARGLDSRVPPPTLQPMAHIVGASISDQRFQMTLLAIFAGSALVLTAMGIFAVVSYSVHERVREIGVRVALGARSGTVMRMVVGRGVVLAGAGAVIGVATSLASSRVLASRLYGITSTDPAVFAAAVAVLRCIAIIAAWIPAYRAARIDPMIALRSD